MPIIILGIITHNGSLRLIALWSVVAKYVFLKWTLYATIGKLTAAQIFAYKTKRIFTFKNAWTYFDKPISSHLTKYSISESETLHVYRAI